MTDLGRVGRGGQWSVHIRPQVLAKHRIPSPCNLLTKKKKDRRKGLERREREVEEERARFVWRFGLAASKDTCGRADVCMVPHPTRWVARELPLCTPACTPLRCIASHKSKLHLHLLTELVTVP